MTKLIILASLIFARERYSLRLCDNPSFLSANHFRIEGTDRKTTEVQVNNENFNVVRVELVGENRSALWMLEYAGEGSMPMIDAVKFTFDGVRRGEE